VPIKGFTNPNFCTTNIACNDWDTQHSYYKSPESRMAKGILATQQGFPSPRVVLVSYFYDCRMLIPPGTLAISMVCKDPTDQTRFMVQQTIQ
jgi:hypothetical protein